MFNFHWQDSLSFPFPVKIQVHVNRSPESGVWLWMSGKNEGVPLSKLPMPVLAEEAAGEALTLLIGFMNRIS